MPRACDAMARENKKNKVSFVFIAFDQSGRAVSALFRAGSQAWCYISDAPRARVSGATCQSTDLFRNIPQPHGVRSRKYCSAPLFGTDTTKLPPATVGAFVTEVQMVPGALDADSK